MSVISENIRKRMWELKLTQEELAKRVGYTSKTSINRIVNGEQDPSIAKLDSFAKALKTTIPALMGFGTDNDDDDGQYGFNLHTLEKRLQKKGYEVEIFSAPEDAAEYIARKCSGKTVGLGDSPNATRIGLIDKLQESHGDNLYISDVLKSKENGIKAITADVFIIGVNGISYQTGEIVNISNRGSRIAGSLFCSNEIIFVVGRNVITPDLTGALYRARNVYAPTSAKAKNYRTPCAETGICPGDCSSTEKICRFTCIQHDPDKLVSATVILIDEDLGY